MKNSLIFIANAPDNLHCTPTCYMMIAKYFDPSFNIPMDEWAVICGFGPGKGTWANGGLRASIDKLAIICYNKSIKQL